MSVPPRRLMPSMPSDSPQTALRDILYHIDLAEAFAAGFNAGTFRDDLRTLYAVTHCIEIISEASRRLAPSLKDRRRRLSGSAWAERATFIGMIMRTWRPTTFGTRCKSPCRPCARSWSKSFDRLANCPDLRLRARFDGRPERRGADQATAAPSPGASGSKPVARGSRGGGGGGGRRGRGRGAGLGGGGRGRARSPGRSRA